MNGNCGYVLQPECLRNGNYHPYDKSTVTDKIDPITLAVTVSKLYPLLNSDPYLIHPTSILNALSYTHFSIPPSDHRCSSFGQVRKRHHQPLCGGRGSWGNVRQP